MSPEVRGFVRSADGTSIAVHTLGGDGPDLIVLGGTLQDAGNYAGLGQLLSRDFTVHILDRRGRGRSGPHGCEYSLAKEAEDLAAIQASTGARLAFGQSYGGLILLEALTRGLTLSAASVFEPGVSIDGSIETDWLSDYRERLARGDARGAFARFIGSNPHAPAITRLVPLWCLRAALGAMPGFPARIAPLLAGNALEHEQITLRDNTLNAYQTIRTRLQLLAGGKSPKDVIDTVGRLRSVIPDAEAVVIPGLRHRSPTTRRPAALAGVIRDYLADGR
ncbi:MAG: alpha/beta fold hydrolase [Tetrasphaera sp.]